MKLGNDSLACGLRASYPAPMLRALILALLLSPAALASGMPEFDLARTSRRHVGLFADESPVAPVQPAPGSPSSRSAEPGTEKATPADPQPRPIYDWFGRGFGISIVATGALALPGAGIGLEACMPIHQRVGIFVRGGILGNIFFEGSCFDFGVRAYYDTSRTFTLYHDLAFRLVYGRILGYFGNELKDHKLHRWGVGGASNLGLEVGATWIRFFAEVSINGAKTLGEEFEVLFFIGLNFGIRFYIGG